MDIDKIPGVDLNSLVGEHLLDAVDFDSAKIKKYSDYLEDANVMRFRLDGIVYTAVESPDDGYRSSLDKLFVSQDEMKNVFQPCKVLARMSGDGDYNQVNDTLELIDCVTGKTILRVGTDNSDDYYPWFVSEWMPEGMAVNAQFTTGERL